MPFILNLVIIFIIVQFVNGNGTDRKLMQQMDKKNAENRNQSAEEQSRKQTQYIQYHSAGDTSPTNTKYHHHIGTDNTPTGTNRQYQKSHTFPDNSNIQYDQGSNNIQYPKASRVYPMRIGTSPKEADLQYSKSHNIPYQRSDTVPTNTNIPHQRSDTVATIQNIPYSRPDVLLNHIKEQKQTPYFTRSEKARQEEAKLQYSKVHNAKENALEYPSVMVKPTVNSVKNLIVEGMGTVKPQCHHTYNLRPKIKAEELREQRRHLLEVGRKKSHMPDKPAVLIKHAKQGNFLDLEPLNLADEGDYGKFMLQRDACGKHLLGTMKLLKLRSLRTKRINTFYVAPEPISGGATSKVFHASPKDAWDMDGRPIKNCVGIKSVMLDLVPATTLQDLKNEKQFLELFTKMPNNRHLIHLYEVYEHHGNGNNRLIFVLELGQQDLMSHLRSKRVEWSDPKNPVSLAKVEADITKILRQVLEAVAEMHRTIIHLDLKSGNMIFVKDKSAAPENVLKIIDFGGSEFINKTHEVAPEASLVANVCRRRNTMWSDDRYTSPEQAIPCRNGRKKDDAELVYPVSSKSDIWSIGVMLIEFLLMTPLFPEIEPIVIKRSQDQANIYNAVINLNRYHYALHQVQVPHRTYYMYLRRMGQNYDKFYKIIKACLRMDPKQRPTARGILDFLDGKCDFYKTSNEKACDMGVRIKNEKEQAKSGGKETIEKQRVDHFLFF